MKNINFTTDDVYDERERMGLNKPSKINKGLIIKKIIDEKGNVIFEGNRIERMMFLKKHFKWTARMTKRGRWIDYIKEMGYKII